MDCNRFVQGDSQSVSQSISRRYAQGRGRNRDARDGHHRKQAQDSHTLLVGIFVVLLFYLLLLLLPAAAAAIASAQSFGPRPHTAATTTAATAATATTAAAATAT